MNATHTEQRGRWQRLFAKGGELATDRDPAFELLLVNIFFGLVLFLFLLYALVTETSGGSGMLWFGGLLTVFLWQTVSASLLPNKMVLYSIMVLSGSTFVLYIHSSHNLQLVMLDLSHIYPLVPVTAALLFLLGPSLSLHDRTSLPQHSPLQHRQQKGEEEEEEQGVEYEDEENGGTSKQQVMKGWRRRNNDPAAVLFYPFFQQKDAPDDEARVSASLSTTPYEHYSLLTRCYHRIKRWYYATCDVHFRCKDARWNLVLYNVCFYICPFMFGLNWSYAILIFPNILISSQQMQQWGGKEASLLTALGFLILFLLSHAIRFLRRQYEGKRTLYFYLHFYLINLFILGTVSGLALAAASSVSTSASGDTVHIHHYFLAMFFFPLTRSNNSLCASIQAFLLGLHLDGMVRFGADSLWNAGDVSA
ncbi:LCCL domain-containing protein [Balamuthia mandrillaris]